MQERHILSLLLENEAGALCAVAGLFSARAYNIESLTVAPTSDASLSRMTIVTTGDHEIIEQIVKQLNKLIDVMSVRDLSQVECINREFAMIKVATSDTLTRMHLMQLCDVFHSRMVDVGERYSIVEFSGGIDKLEAFVSAVGKDKIIETARSGLISMSRDENNL